MSDFLERFREWRENSGVSLFDIVLITGLPPGLICDIEIGAEDPTPDQRQRLEEIMR